jgi:hypothetical protein
VKPPDTLSQGNRHPSPQYFACLFGILDAVKENKELWRGGITFLDSIWDEKG